MTLAVIDISCMEKTLISVKEAPIPEVEKRQKDRRRRCVFCGSLASHEAVFKVQGASLVEWYCSLHVKGLVYCSMFLQLEQT
jgi:putative exporter of polyketide antibiotics